MTRGFNRMPRQEMEYEERLFGVVADPLAARGCYSSVGSPSRSSFSRSGPSVISLHLPFPISQV